MSEWPTAVAPIAESVLVSTGVRSPVLRRPDETLTTVELDAAEGQYRYRLLFGDVVDCRWRADCLGFARATVYLAPGTVFGIDLWEADVTGRTRSWATYVLKSGTPGETLTRVQRVAPGAHVLIASRGARRCRFMLAWLAELEKQTNLVGLRPEFFLACDLWLMNVIPARTRPAARVPVH